MASAVVAFISLALLDQDHHRLQEYRSPPIRAAADWKKLCLGPLAPDPAARSAIVGLHVEPLGADEDLHGTASFGDLRLRRAPQVTLTSNHALNLFADPHQVEIQCVASGFPAGPHSVVFQVHDAGGVELARSTKSLAAETGRSRDRQVHPATPAAFVGRVAWKPPLVGPGSYCVTAQVVAAGKVQGRAQLDLAVIVPERPGGRSEFGWSLPRGSLPLSLAQLNELLPSAGVRWLKYPLWPSDRKSQRSLEQLIDLGERLSAQGMELVGLLPAALAPQAADEEHNPSAVSPMAAEYFAADPKTWCPALEPVMARLAAQVRFWQLGDDADPSFADDPSAEMKIGRVKAAMDRSGQDARIGVGWDWHAGLPKAAVTAAPPRPCCHFLALPADRSLTDEQLAARLDATRDAQVLRWVTLEALPREGSPTAARAENLVKRMLLAKMHGAEGIFYADPLDSRHGLINQDGTPGELFLPWRTAALRLGGARYHGSLQLAGGSSAPVFLRGGEAVVALWNDRAVEEPVRLGDEIRQSDLWGASLPLQHDGSQRRISVGRLPTFLLGLSEPLARWQVDCGLARDRIASIAGQSQQNSLRINNGFSCRVSGRVTVTGPAQWRIEPPESRFQLAPGAQAELPLEIALLPNALTGRQSLHLDFEIQADRAYRFRVHRSLEVGLGDVLLEAAARLNGQGQMEVRQRLVNHGQQEVSFRCTLLAPDRRAQTSQVVALMRGEDTKTYRLPDGEELLGKTLWLRAEEVDGPRVLNYRLVP
ncbi:MAG: hypothetical protein ABSG68_19565 [Thermoguttaceae bacterium]